MARMSMRIVVVAAIAAAAAMGLPGEARGAAPAAPTTQGSEVQRLIEEGRALALKEEHAAAAEKFRAAIKLAPDSHRARGMLAVSLVALGELEAAQAEAARAASLAPREYRYQQIAGHILIRQGKIDEGRAKYEAAVKLSPKDAGVIYADLAAALGARNDRSLDAQVEAALKAAASADPPHLDSLFYLGQGYAAAGKQEGREYLQRYLDAVMKLPAEQRDAQKVKLARQLIRALDAIRR